VVRQLRLVHATAEEVMKQALMIAACVLFLTSPTLAQSATSSNDLLPASHDLGPEWVQLPSTLPAPDPDYPEARGWYAGPDGSRVILQVSVPPGADIADIWEATAQALEADAPASLLNPEHPSPTIQPIVECSAIRRVQGLPASFPVLTEAITACRTTDAILHARVSGTWQGLDGTAASDALIHLLLDYRSGRPWDAAPTPPATSLTAMLPDTTEVPLELELESDGAIMAEAMSLTFPAPAEAQERLARWGWQEHASRRFIDAGEPVLGRPSFVEISLHQFAFEAGAVAALPYFAEARAEARGLSVVPVEAIQPDEAVVVGQGAEGNEFTLFVRLGNVLVRVTAVTPDSSAEDVAREVANVVVTKHDQPNGD
jgi:hypothetical protein